MVVGFLTQFLLQWVSSQQMAEKIPVTLVAAGRAFIRGVYARVNKLPSIW